jgi:putative hydrolase of the HAD superfamily
MSGMVGFTPGSGDLVGFMAIKAVIFDADGVVIHPWRFAAYLEQRGITRQMTKGFYNGIFEDCLLGKRDLKSVLPPYLTEWGWPGPVDDFVSTWLDVENATDERVLIVIQRLRESGYTCCLATLQEHNRAAYIKNVMGFDAIFDLLFFSCEIGHTKKDHAFYAHITHTLRLEPQEILFWDDSPGHVAAALAFG